MRINHRNYYFQNIASLTLWCWECSKAVVRICFTKEVLFKMLQNLQKFTCAGVFLNRVRLATLIRKDSGKGVFLWIFRNYEGHLFYKTLQGDCFVVWKNPHVCWSKISFFSPLRFLILIDSILIAIVMKCRNFIFKLFTKERRNSLEFPGVLSLLSICFSCLSLFKRL